jgi:hypothetical protein
MKPVDPWALRTKVRYLYDAHARSHALEREVRDLRARLKEHENLRAAADDHRERGRVPAQHDGANDRA